MLLHFSTMLFYEQLRLHFMVIEYQLNNLTERSAFIIKLKCLAFLEPLNHDDEVQYFGILMHYNNIYLQTN